jgi:ATP/maltotriose-dependent transcriptional regulator MalT
LLPEQIATAPAALFVQVNLADGISCEGMTAILASGAAQVHLERILNTTRATVDERKNRIPLAELEQRAKLHMPRGFARALRARSAQAPAIIAELKRRLHQKG